MNSNTDPDTNTTSGKILIVDARVRYWEDATVNGKEDTEDGALIPFREGDSWKPSIDLTSGKIIGWPEGTTAEIHYKVCDDGDYWIADADGTKRMKWGGEYVPDDFLCMGDRGYGDYIILTVLPDGKISEWSSPVIDFDRWIALTQVPGSRFRAGDHVKHRPTGEKWELACDEEHGEVMPSGWPMGIAKAEHCTLIETATDEKRMEVLTAWSAEGRGREAENDLRTLTARRQLNTSMSYPKERSE